MTNHALLITKSAHDKENDAFCQGHSANRNFAPNSDKDMYTFYDGNIHVNC